MKLSFLAALTLAPTLAFAQIGSSPGSAETLLQNNKGLIHIEGKAAMILFDSMTAVDGKSVMVEAGPNMFVKEGQNISCSFELEMDPESENAYTCTLSIEDASTGKIEKL
jgi:hypothetical protein